MEEKIKKGKEKLLRKLDFPDDIARDFPKIIVTGNEEISVENYKGLISFGDTIVKINSEIGKIIIEGRNFEILFIGDTTITMSGKFKKVSYEEHAL